MEGRFKGRGALTNPTARFLKGSSEAVDDGWYRDEAPDTIATEVRPEPARSVISRNDSPDIAVEQSINPYRGCEHGCVYCMRGDTPILMADGTNRPLADLRAGDQIYGTVKKGWYRRYEKTQVLAHWSVIKPAYRVLLQDGTELVAGGDHRFLTDRGWKFVTGAGRGPECRAHLTTRHKLMGVGQQASSVVQEADYRSGYLCGSIRGDGLLASHSHDRPGRGISHQHQFRLALSDSRAPSRTWHAGSLAGIFDAEGTTDPAITRKSELAGQAVKSSARLKIVSIVPIPGAMRLYDITTGTGDFIANGVVSHNCYARPSHAYMDLSPGLDFETRLFYKADAARLLREELARPGYACRPITLGANTDPYQPVEKELGVTRSLLAVMEQTRHPVSIVTKGTLILRDLDLLRSLAADRLVQVFVSVTSLDAELKRTLEPRAASPQARLRVIAALRAAQIPTGVFVAPIIPAVNDMEVERILAAVAAAGAQHASYVLLRLPYEIKHLFRQWLAEHLPQRADHVMSLIRWTRGGRDNDPRFGVRMRGVGTWAQLLRDRFQLACRQRGLDQRVAELSTQHFRPPRLDGQLTLEL
jgi:DNA repair photolyase